MSTEHESRARQQEIHELRMKLKEHAQAEDVGTERHREITRQLEALSQDNDAAEDQRFTDLRAEHPLKEPLV